MGHLRELQREFAAYVLRGKQGIEHRVVDDQALSSEQRLGIYQNAYRQRLRGTIETDHDVLGTYLGDALFDTLVDDYLRASPSRSPSLRQFCDALPSYLAMHAPFDQHPEIGELAGFERCLLGAFDARGELRLDPSALAQLPAEQWPGMTLGFHPSLSIFHARFNTVQIWQAIKAGTSPPAVEAAGAGSWLVWRNAERLTAFRSVGEAELAAIDGCRQGGNFTQMCETLMHDYAEADVAAQALGFLRAWLTEGMVTRLG